MDEVDGMAGNEDRGGMQVWGENIMIFTCFVCFCVCAFSLFLVFVCVFVLFPCIWFLFVCLFSDLFLFDFFFVCFSLLFVVAILLLLYYFLSELPLASFSKRGLVLNYSCGSEFNIHANENLQGKDEYQDRFEKEAKGISEMGY